MKTPQEQAEAMAWKLAKAQHEALRLSESRMINTSGHGIDYLLWDNCRVPLVNALQREIPLPQLIAVAQAAKKYAGSVSECCMMGERTGEVCDLHCALEALRATGKVEL